MFPSVGRIVHYFDCCRSEQPIAAIITRVGEQNRVDMKIFPHNEITINLTDVEKRSETFVDCCWDWPQPV